MSHIVSSSAPISGAHTVKQYAGFGILGSAIPTTGDSGGSPVANDGVNANGEYHWRVETPPSAGALTIYPDLSFGFDATGLSNTTYTWVYRLYEDGVSVGTATVSLVVGVVALTQASRFDSSQTFYTHTLSAGAVVLSQSARYDNTNVFYAHTLAGSISLNQSSRYTNSNNFYAHSLTASVTLTAARFDNTPAFYAHSIYQVGGSQSLVQSATYSNANTFYSHSVAPGGVGLVASRYNNSNSFYGHSLSQTGPSQSLTQATRLNNTPTFYTQTIAIGAVNLVADRFDNTNTHYAHSLSQGAAPQALEASRFDNINSFYSHVVTTGTVTLYPAFYQNQPSFYVHRIGGLEGKILYARAFTKTPEVVAYSAEREVAVLTKQLSVSVKRKSKFSRHTGRN